MNEHTPNHTLLTKSEKSSSRHDKFMYHGLPAAALALGVTATGAGLALNHLNKSTEVGSSVETVLNGSSAINAVDQGVKDILKDHPDVSYNSVAGITDEGFAVERDYVSHNKKSLQPGTQIAVKVLHNNWGDTYTKAALADPANLAPLEQSEK